MARIGPDMFQVEIGDFVGYPAGGKAHDLRNADSSHMISIIVGQRLDFDVVNYSSAKQTDVLASRPLGGSSRYCRCQSLAIIC